MQRTAAGEWLIAFLLLIYPALAMLFDGAASALMIAAAVFSLIALLFRWRAPQGHERLDGFGLALCIALAAPLAAVALSTLAHGNPVFPVWDSPSRFLFVIPVFLALRRARPQVCAWMEPAFTLGALTTLVIILFIPKDWGGDRLGSRILNPIHFGDLALAFGVLSAVSLNGWRRDKAWVRALKIAGLAAGLATSLITGSRGGWVALPIVAALAFWELRRGKSARWKVLTPVIAVLLFASVYASSNTVRDRIDVVSSNLTQYEHGHEDTSVGVRLQLYRTALYLIGEHPVLGLGGHGFRDAMGTMVQQGKLTPFAADLGKQEVHNQLLAYTADYGIVGGLALLSIYFVPALFFLNRLRSAPAGARCAARMGFLFALMFFIFGLTVETFDLKGTVSIYALVVAALAAIADRAHDGTSNPSSL